MFRKPGPLIPGTTAASGQFRCQLLGWSCLGAMECRDEEFGGQAAWVPATPLLTCAALGRLYSLTVGQFSLL